MLMIGVTLSVGGIVTSSAINQFGLSVNADSTGASIQNSSFGIQVALVYAAVTPSTSCPIYQGSAEGTTMAVALYNFGTSDFSVAGLFVNASVSAGTFGTLTPGGMSVYNLTLGSCSHSSGQTFVALDYLGDVVQVGS
jgi:hypothetical protein